MGQGGARGADDAEDVDVEDAVPLVVVVVLDGALGADARVVDEDVEAAEVGHGGGHGGADGGVVADVGGVAAQRLVDAARVEVEHGDAGAAGGEEFGGGPADAGRSAGDEGLEPREVLHVAGVGHAAAPFWSVAPCRARSAAQKAPSG